MTCVAAVVLEAIVWFDGACSGNPGPMGAGAVVQVGAAVHELSRPGGIGTNNEAEYQGLLLGLQQARQAGAQAVTVRGDSQLVLRQLEGRYAVRAPNLQPLHREAVALLRAFSQVRLEWVPRDANARADALARRGVTERR